MDWNPLTWTFATPFFGFSLLKWGIVIGGIIFLALLRKIIIGTRTIHRVHATAHSTAAETEATIAEMTASPTLSNDAIKIVAAAAVQEMPAVKQKVTKVKAFKRAVVVAKKKRSVKMKKIIPSKAVEVIPASVPVQPIVNVKTEAVVIEPKPVIVAKAKQKAKPKKKVVKAKPLITPKIETTKTTPVESVAKVEVVQPKVEAPMIIAKASNVSPAKQKISVIPKTKAKKVIAKPKVAAVVVAKESKKEKAETKTTALEEKSSTPATKPLRTRNPGFI